MKKILFNIFGILTMYLSMVSCNGCKSVNENPTVADTVVCDSQEVAEMIVENIISTDRQYMYLNYAKDYRWFETCITLQDFLDEENEGTITSVSNIFQVVEESETGADVHVVLATHTPDTVAYEVKHTFWIEDYLLNEEAITVTFKDAYDRMMQANCPKPHSKHCVLRKAIGPVDANPQYIFGNSQAQVYVDATTGDVSTENPVFPKAQGFKMPLGEWP